MLTKSSAARMRKQSCVSARFYFQCWFVNIGFNRKFAEFNKVVPVTAGS